MFVLLVGLLNPINPLPMVFCGLLTDGVGGCRSCGANRCCKYENNKVWREYGAFVVVVVAFLPVVLDNFGSTKPIPCALGLVIVVFWECGADDVVVEVDIVVFVDANNERAPMMAHVSGEMTYASKGLIMGLYMSKNHFGVVDGDVW